MECSSGIQVVGEHFLCYGLPVAEWTGTMKSAEGEILEATNCAEGKALLCLVSRFINSVSNAP